MLSTNASECIHFKHHCITEPCEHAKEALRREYLVREFPVSAKVLFQTLFDDDSGFMRAYLQGKGSTSKIGLEYFILLTSGVMRNFRREQKLQKPSKKSGIFQPLSSVVLFTERQSQE